MAFFRKLNFRAAFSGGAAVAVSLAGLAVVMTGSTGHAQTAPPDRTYEQRCASCHQATGRGVPGAFPRLAGNPNVTGNATVVIHMVLNGQRQMPSFKGLLTDDKVAAVVTRIRASWGNQGGAVTAAEVKAVRSGAK